MAPSGKRTEIGGTLAGLEPLDIDDWDFTDEQAVPTPVQAGRGGPTGAGDALGAGRPLDALELADLEDATARGSGLDDELEAAIPTAWSPQRSAPPGAGSSAPAPAPTSAPPEGTGEEFDLRSSWSLAVPSPSESPGPLPVATSSPAVVPRPRSSAPPDVGTEFKLGVPSAAPARVVVPRPSGAGKATPAPLSPRAAPEGTVDLDIDPSSRPIGPGDLEAMLELDHRAHPAHLDLGADFEVDTVALDEARVARRAQARTRTEDALGPAIPPAAALPLAAHGRDAGVAISDLSADLATPPPSSPPAVATAPVVPELEVPELEVPIEPRFSRGAGRSRSPVPDASEDRSLSEPPPPAASRERTAPAPESPSSDAPAPGETDGPGLRIELDEPPPAAPAVGPPGDRVDGELALDVPDHTSRPAARRRSFDPPPLDEDLDEPGSDAFAAPLDLASEPRAAPAASADGRPLPTGRTPDRTALGITADHAAHLAGYGPAPTNPLLVPVYAARVLVRRRSLRAELRTAAGALARAEHDRDLALADVFTTQRSRLYPTDGAADPGPPVGAAGLAAAERQREFAQVSAEFQTRERELAVRASNAERVVGALRQAEEARRAVHTQRLGDYNRVAARFQRLQIEHRNALKTAPPPPAEPPGTSVSSRPPGGTQPRVSRLEAQLTELFPVAKRLQAALEEAQRELETAERATREAVEHTRVIEAERKALDLWYAKQTRHVEAGVTAAESAELTARADVVRAALSIGTATLDTRSLTVLREHDDRVRDLALVHHRLALACDAHDVERYRLGLVAIGAAIGAILLVIALAVIF